MNTRRFGAFTLIELLVVIAIIAILVSILMPSLAKAKYQARLVSCMSNMHNIGTGVMTYSAEYNGQWPARPTQAPGRLPSVEMLKVQELDDRPLYRGIISMDLFGCPLSKPQTFSYEDISSDFIYSTYEMYFGHELESGKPESGLTGNRESYTYNGKTFTVMLADWERLTPASGSWLTSHPDTPASLTFEEYKDLNYGSYGTYSWTGYAGIGPPRGGVDRSFLYTDCSVRILRGLKTSGDPLASDPRTVMVPAISEYSYQMGFLPPR